MIEVLHVPYTYYPDNTGGTETYVAALAEGLRAKGMSVAIAAPVDKAAPGQTVHDGIDVYRYPVAAVAPGLEDQYGDGDPVAAAEFSRLLQRVRPHIVHLHAWTSAVSLRCVRAARAVGARVAFTYHTPAVSCARGSLMIYGRAVCDGALYVDRCSRCVLQQHGVPLAIGTSLAALPPAIGRALSRIAPTSASATALRMTELIAARHAAFRSLVREVDAVIAVQDWVYDLLIYLGAEPAKLVLSRLALPERSPRAAARGAKHVHASERSIRLAYFGRIDATKGVHVVTRALRNVPDADIALDLFGAPQGREGEAYLAGLQSEMKGDQRVTFRDPVPTGEVVERMREYDAVVVPSIWMETGPLVVPEAMSAGVPVIGSARGGIPSFIRDRVDGILVPPGDVDAWTAVLLELAREPQILASLAAAIRPPETMSRIVAQMTELYARL